MFACVKFKLVLMFVVLFCLAHTPNVLAHGIGYTRLTDQNVVSLEFNYSSSEPVSYASIKIYPPKGSGLVPEQEGTGGAGGGGQEIEFQNGRTDALGRFSFLPPVDGTWTVRLKDGQGHASEVVLEIKRMEENEKNVSAQVQETENNKNISPYKISFRIAIFGLSLFLNLMCLYYFISYIIKRKKT
ncbi:hypothetical protein [Desulfovibrio litoralis]|uniref:Nickel transport protein n=1 Tax=Desulfovibrio litoralis DSM 11393 TaxID=1121455 RepID=A0A1M7S6N0_9BACT|nr:hypothetical protein [Desulfovibrio litoralis]SHN54015.1 nickel transport protein [Desulfovibrio litoralis DSM 11393]